MNAILPSGCPNLANAAAEMNTGIEEGDPKIVVDGSHQETLRSTRGIKKNWDHARSFSLHAST